jgi:hypothetical protein
MPVIITIHGRVKAYISGSGQATTYLSFPNGAIADLSPWNNPAWGMNSSSALAMGPVLDKATLDMQTGSMLLVFSRPVDFAQFDMAALELVGNSSDAGERLGGMGDGGMGG